MNEASYACLGGGGEHRARSLDVAGDESVAVGGVDDAGDVNDHVRAGDEAVERSGVLQRSGDPFDAVARNLRSPGERADGMAGGDRGLDQRRADEPGPAGDRERRHSKARWLRWTTADRGA